MISKRAIDLIKRLFILVMIPNLLATATVAGNPIDISVDPSKPGKAIPPAFIGVSYETEAVLPNDKGIHYFRPDNKALIAQFQALGIKSLRIGGSSVDSKRVGIPGNEDIDALFGFAKAAGVKVIYSVRIKDADPQSAAAIAKYIYDHYAESLDCFAIGNEPADIGFNYASFHTEWKRMMEAMAAVAPGARFSGPDINPNPKWSKDFVADFADAGHLAYLTGHLYPGGCSYKNPGRDRAIKDLIPNDPAVARDRMLSPSWYGNYERDRTGLAAAVADKGLPYRLGETNSFWYGGLKGASDTYAAALWGLDYLHWWAEKGAAGLNFHTGDIVSGPIPCQYAVFVTSDKGYSTHPLGYGMKAFDLAGYGNFIPVTLGKSNKANLTAYASLDFQKMLSITLINKEYEPATAEAEVHLHLPSPFSIAGAQVVRLSAPNGDISAKSGVTLGGAPIGDDGTWNGSWTPLPATAGGGEFTIKVPPASAAIVKAQLR